ncbi:N-acetyllactosaminide 3-alpha-galactosyltransferase [Dictyocaulus viviparus]|uniref:N-acetylgalactosaminide beta-1,3-galactosyltransferase n=1 Tax=Dictyocaulus viviparus TaxID=29172 RepID=A0A0D8YC03_DICVI|nr:N-acetyllactosaminide 3-alpha-galactosyltransferase [Dictyocaulus viviparus]
MTSLYTRIMAKNRIDFLNYLGAIKSRIRHTLKKRRCKSIHIVFVWMFFMFAYFIYKIQYKTGIEILPFIPIDDSGFMIYNESLLNYAKVSEAALQQKKRGFILCWVMTTSINHKTRVQAIRSTWLNRCDASHIFTNSDRFLDKSTPYHTIFSELPMSYFKLFWKTRLALYYLYTNVSSEFDWYFKADDDTYVIMENLRSYLSTFNPDEPLYLGFRLKRRMPNHGYNAGGSGYVISRAAMKIFAEQLFHAKSLCPYHEWEDLAVARCLESVGIYAVDTRDEQRRQRFLPWNPEYHYNGDLIKFFLMDPIEFRGPDIFHENLISMHHLDPSVIRLIDGIIFGVASGGPDIFHENLISMHHLDPSVIRLIDGILYGVAAGMWNRSTVVEQTLQRPPRGQ